MFSNSGRNFGKNSGRTMTSSIKGAVFFPFTCLRRRLKLSCRISQYFCVSVFVLEIREKIFSLSKYFFNPKYFLFISSCVPESSAKTTILGNPCLSSIKRSGQKLQANLRLPHSPLPFKKLVKNLIAILSVL